jgi:hypothetical protein
MGRVALVPVNTATCETTHTVPQQLRLSQHKSHRTLQIAALLVGLVVVVAAVAIVTVLQEPCGVMRGSSALQQWGQ